MSQQFVLKHFQHSELQEVIELIVNSFSENDPLLASKRFTIDMWKNYYQKILPMFLQAQKKDPKALKLSFVYKTEGRIVATIFGVRYHQFLNLMQYGIEQMEPVLKIPFTEEQKDTTIYVEGLCVDRKYMNRGVGVKFLIQVNDYLIENGIIYGLGFAYNPISLLLAKAIKCEVLYKGILPYGSSDQYQIYRACFPLAKKLNLRPKL